MKFFLLVLSFGVEPSAHVHDDYDTAHDCYAASFQQSIKRDQFSVCVGTDEISEQDLARHIMVTFGEMPERALPHLYPHQIQAMPVPVKPKG